MDGPSRQLEIQTNAAGTAKGVANTTRVETAGTTGASTVAWNEGRSPRLLRDLLPESEVLGQFQAKPPQANIAVRLQAAEKAGW